MTRPAVSVVMANYNCAPYIGAAIASLRSQTFADWELLLVDDASRDDSVAVARRAAGDDPRIRIIEQPQNQGAARARNHAFDLALGDWLAIFDSDDLMAPTRIERLLALAAESGAEIVADNQLLFSSEKTEPFIARDKAQRLSAISLPAFIRSNCLYADLPSLGYLKPLFRRDAVGDLRYVETLRNGEDYDLVTRVMTRGARLQFLPEPLYSYRIHTTSVSRTLTEEDLTGLLKANEALAASLAPMNGETAAAVARRQRTLQALLGFTRVIDDLKCGRRAKGLAAAVSQPAVWPLFSRPVKARLRRLGKAVRAKIKAPALAEADPTQSDCAPHAP